MLTPDDLPSMEDLSFDIRMSGVVVPDWYSAEMMHAAMEKAFAEGAAQERRLIQTYLRQCDCGDEADALDFGAHREA